MTRIEKLKRAMLNSMSPADLDALKATYSEAERKEVFAQMTETEKLWVHIVKKVSPKQIGDLKKKLLSCKTEEELAALKSTAGGIKLPFTNKTPDDLARIQSESIPLILKLVFNYLTPAEKNAIIAIKEKAQASTPEPKPDPEIYQVYEPPEPIDFSQLIAANNVHLKILGWSKDQGTNYLLEKYGKRSRQLLSDEELLEFCNAIEAEALAHPVVVS